MAPLTIQLVTLFCVGATLVQCQRFQQSAPSVVEPDYDFSDVPQQRSQAPISSRATGPSPALRNSVLNDATVKTTTPIVAILKQINRHNEDGSYTYGYEGEDGSFKIETKLANGEVMGKYGYVDSDGKVRVVEYGANRYGFQPSGEGITVPPPNLVEEVSEEPKKGQAIDADYDEPIIVQKPRQRQPTRQQQQQPAARPAPSRPQPQPQQQQFASATFQSRNSFQSEESVDPQQNTAPVQFLPEEQPPARSQSFAPAPPPPQFSAPSQFAVQSQFSASAPTFSAFLTSDNAPPPRHAPARLQPEFQSSNSAPVPPRPLSFAGAAPAGPAPPRPQSFANAAPVPPRPASFPGASFTGPSEPSFQSQPAFRPRPAQQFFQPSPSFVAEPQRPVQRQSSTSILDQLAQDYALPQGGARPLHDITFGAQ